MRSAKLPGPAPFGSPEHERGFERLLSAPSLPVGRERELERLRIVMDAVAGGERRVVLVAGGAGVGKSSLIQQLQPLVRARGGRYVAGKFDQHNEREATAVMQALSALGRLLIADGEEERAQVRGKILRVLGAQAGLARVVPEFARLLVDVPEPRAVDPAHAAARMVEVVVGLLRAVASPACPLVLVLDDLQWSGTLCTRLIESVLAGDELTGLLLVAAYRNDELPSEHPLVSAMARWANEGAEPEVLCLDNLPPERVAQLLSHVLAVAHADALPLARVLAPYAGGNPYDTVELVNALRDEGLLVIDPEALRWNDDAVAQFLARTTVTDILAARMAQLSTHAQELLMSLACMGTQTSREVARAAIELNPGEFEAALGLLRERGFVLRENVVDGMLRLRHDRVQQIAFDSLTPSRRGELHLALARRLVAHDGLASLAADQYVRAVDQLDGAADSRRAASLLRDAAAQARLIGNHLTSYRMQHAALRLLEGAQQTGEGDAAALAQCEIDYQLTLHSIGLADEADAIYRRIEARQPGALILIDAACAQISSLINRDRLFDATELGLRVMRDLGLNAPSDFGASENFSARFERTRHWVETFDLARECARAESASPRVVALGKLISRTLPATLMNPDLRAWLNLQSQTLWEEHGPCAPLAVSFSRASITTIPLTQDWRTGFLAVRQALDLCEAREWETEASHVRFLYGLCGYCFEPLERLLSEAERAREGLLASGDLRAASFSYRQTALCLFECGYPLSRYAEEVDAALALARRADIRQATQRCLVDRQLLRALLQEGAYPTVFDSHASDEARYLAGDVHHGWMVWYQSSWHAITCAIFADGPGLSHHARRTVELRHVVQSFYSIVWTHWLSGLAAAWELQGAAGAGIRPGRDSLAELDDAIEWLRQRAIDAPSNFRHMHLHLQAERAWSLGQLHTAARCFDEALGALEQIHRPWHQALIAERAARLHLAQGWEHSGSQLLLEAQQLYGAWGAMAKVAQLRAQTGAQARAEPRTAQVVAERNSLGSDQLVSLAVLRASQALNSERNPMRLKARVQEVLGGMTGATRVVLALWDEDAGEWVLGEADGQGDDAVQVPLTAFRYAERTREPLLLADAVADDRFASDVYLQGIKHCSLMVVPILRGGAVRAMLVLENRVSRGAFSAVRLDAVTMIAGQLAGSLESAQLNERLERKVREQTRQLRETQSRLVDEAKRAGMAQIAINVLHNVGNVLTSVNVSTHVLTAQVRQSRASRVADLAALLEAHSLRKQDLFAEGGKGPLLPGYARQLADALASERERFLVEIEQLSASVEHIKNVVAMQQSYAGAGGTLESGDISQLADAVTPRLPLS